MVYPLFETITISCIELLVYNDSGPSLVRNKSANAIERTQIARPGFDNTPCLITNACTPSNGRTGLSRTDKIFRVL